LQFVLHIEQEHKSEYMRKDEMVMRMDVRDIGWKGVDWIHLAQDRNQWQAVVNTGSMKSGEFLE